MTSSGWTHDATRWLCKGQTWFRVDQIVLVEPGPVHESVNLHLIGGKVRTLLSTTVDEVITAITGGK